MDYDGRVYRYRELYGCAKDENGQTLPNTGEKLPPDEIARKIKEIEDKYERGKRITGIADPSIWDTSRGENGSVIKMMERNGVFFEKANNNRIAGKMQLHYRLAFDDEGLPMMYVFNTCKDFIRTIPALIYDPNDIEDVETNQEDHIYDETRYFLMLNPIKSRKEIPKRSRVYNLLDD